jgi:pantothenate synthetase
MTVGNQELWLILSVAFAAGLMVWSRNTQLAANRKRMADFSQLITDVDKSLEKNSQDQNVLLHNILEELNAIRIVLEKKR